MSWVLFVTVGPHRTAQGSGCSCIQIFFFFAEQQRCRRNAQNSSLVCLGVDIVKSYGSSSSASARYGTLFVVRHRTPLLIVQNNLFRL